MSIARHPVIMFGKPPVSSLPDYSGLGLSRIWALFKTSEATIDYCMLISRNGSETAGQTRYVFWDSNGKISTTSQVSTTTTPNESTTLQGWFDAGVGTDDYMVLYWFCQKTGVFVHWQGSATTAAPLLAENATLKTVSGETYIDFDGATDCYFWRSVGGISQLDSGNSFYIATLSHNDTVSGVGTILCSNLNSTTSNDSRILQFNDSRTNKVCSIIKNTSGTQWNADLDSQQNSTDQKRIITSLDGTTLTSYFNGTAQTDTETISGSWVNDNLMFGAQRGGASLLTGGMWFVGIGGAAITGGQVTSLDAKLAAIV